MRTGSDVANAVLLKAEGHFCKHSVPHGSMKYAILNIQNWPVSTE